MARMSGEPIPDRSPSPGPGIVGFLAAILAAAGAAALAFGLPSGTQSVRASTVPATTAGTALVTAPGRVHPRVRATAMAQVAHPAPTTTTSPMPATAPLATPTAATTPPVVAPAAAVPTSAAPLGGVTPATTSSLAALVAEVVASGIDPGSNWTWSMGDTASQCGAIGGNNVATGCTFGAAGFARTVFSGSPTLALVAHELANAETENDAVPSLMSEVVIDEGGTSWSSIDAVASCLVEHFMGFQDLAAGTWQCPASLATLVAQDIHHPASVTTGAPPS
jgi:hypothetical protein